MAGVKALLFGKGSPSMLLAFRFFCAVLTEDCKRVWITDFTLELAEPVVCGLRALYLFSCSAALLEPIPELML